MYLVGDRVKFPSSTGGEAVGEIELVEEQLDGSYSYVINTDDNGIALRNSDNDVEMTLLNDPELDFN